MEPVTRRFKHLDKGGDIIKQNTLLALMLIMCMMASNVGGAFAESLGNQTSDNLTDSSSTQSLTGNTTTGVSNTTATENTTNNESTSNTSNSSSLNESSNGLAMVDSAKSSSNSAANDNSTNSINDSTNNSGNSTNTTAAAGENSSTIKGIWVQTGDALSLNVTQLLGMGITDVYVKCNIYSDPTYKTILSQVVSMFNGTGIRVNAWVTCFKDANGNWVNPIGTAYNYTVQVAYEGWYQTWQQVWYKAWYKYNGHWTWKWTYFMKYNWVWGDTTFNQTVTGYNTTHNDEVISAISDMVKNYGVGVNLDYCRYPGTAYEYTNGTEAITSFVEKVYNTVKSINSDATVSVDTMPEGSVNAYYYGQNYTQLAQYTDYLVVMAYKGNYNENTSWIGKVTSYIINQTNGKPVVVGLQTYESDSNVTPLSASELQEDINESLNNGASGYALFRYGLIDGNYTGTNTTTNNTTTSDNSTNGTTTNSTTTSDNSTTNSTVTNNTTSYTISEIEDTATRVATFVANNSRLPNYVTINGTQVSMPDFLKLLVDTLLNIYNNDTSSVTLGTYSSATNSSENVTAGNIQKSEYVTMAESIASFMESNNRAPNYASSSIGNMGYESLVYMYSKILAFAETNSRLPNYNSVKTWTNITTNNTTTDNTTTSDNTTTNNSTTTSDNTTTNSTVTNNTTTSYTLSEIEDAATRVATFVANNSRLPNYVTIGTQQVSMPDFLKLLVDTLLNIYNNDTSSVTLGTYSSATNSSENVTAGNIQKSEYVTMAESIASFMESNNRAPNYASSSIGNMGYESLVYMYSKILAFAETNSRLPNYNSVKTWTNITTNNTTTTTNNSSSTIPSEYEKYLVATTNCQSTNSVIIAKANSIISSAGATTTYAKAVAIYNWVRDNITYSFYSDTEYGAVKTLSLGKGNCCDKTHLLIALLRAAGIPARYVHGYCYFTTSGHWYGHVWAEVYVDGTWYTADASSSRNSFGTVKNWNTKTATIYGKFASISF